MKDTGWILFTIAIGVIVFLQICKGPVHVDSVSKEKYAALEQKVKDTVKYYQDMLAADSAAINAAEQATADQHEKTEIYQQSLAQAQATINRLKAKVDGAKLEPKDETFVSVSQHYVEGCDSLSNQVTVLNSKIDDYEEQSSELVKLMSYEVSLRDSVLNNEREFNRKFQSQLNNCMTQLHQKTTEKQPVQVYGGIGLFGNKINPLAGGQVNVSLRARNSQIYEITGATIGNTWYAGVGTKFLISFKR